MNKKMFFPAILAAIMTICTTVSFAQDNDEISVQWTQLSFGYAVWWSMDLTPNDTRLLTSTYGEKLEDGSCKITHTPNLSGFGKHNKLEFDCILGYNTNGILTINSDIFHFLPKAPVKEKLTVTLDNGVQFVIDGMMN